LYELSHSCSLSKASRNFTALSSIRKVEFYLVGTSALRDKLEALTCWAISLNFSFLDVDPFTYLTVSRIFPKAVNGTRSTTPILDVDRSSPLGGAGRVAALSPHRSTTGFIEAADRGDVG